MGIINVLPTDISNKIAAGEVVERPASVIKELVENSIDSGATVITVEIKKGGSSYMRVTDNGCGMNEEDARICFLRHATSKIHEEADLNAIYTLGFRGEALSSIGAVSEVTLYTKREDSRGVCVTCKGGEILSSDEAGIPDGTTVTVENLFYNIPARAKFLKRDQTEAGYITDIVTRCIFAHPEISFKLTVNGKETLYSAGDNNLTNCIYTVYGRDYAKSVLEVNYEENGVKVTGIIGKGNVSRPNRNYQSFFVNRRYIKSPMLTKALEEAYKNQIMIGKYPMAVLNIEINPELVDINVHPTKLEAKFSDEQLIYRCVYNGTKNSLYALPNIPKIERASDSGTSFMGLSAEDLKRLGKSSIFEKNKITGKTPTFDEADRTHQRKIPEFGNSVQDFEKSANSETIKETTPQQAPPKHEEDVKRQIYSDIKSNSETEINSSASKPAPMFTGEAFDFEKAKKMKYNDFSENELNSAIIESRKSSEPINSEPKDTNAVSAASSPEDVYIEPYFTVIGQLFDSYIIVQKDNEMLLIDQHAAHERLKYEELLSDMKSKNIMSQILIEPVVVNLSATEMAAYMQNKDEINSMGFDSEEFGDSEVIIRSVPGDLEPGETEELIIELITQSEALKKELITEKNERLTYTIACKAAIKANMKMSVSEMETLVRRVFRLKNINTCPHGRPIIISMTKKEIEKEFKRIV